MRKSSEDAISLSKEVELVLYIRISRGMMLSSPSDGCNFLPRWNQKIRVESHVTF